MKSANNLDLGANNLTTTGDVQAGKLKSNVASRVLLFDSGGNPVFRMDGSSLLSFDASGLSGNRTHVCQDTDGTIAHLSDIPAGALAVKDTVATADINNDAVIYAKLQNLGSYKMIANNTGSAADAAEHVFKDVAEQNYSGTIAWTGTTAPSGTLIQNYQWTQIGKMVTIRINLSYSVAGSALSAVTMTLPSDCPTPKEPTGFTAANEYMYTGSGGLSVGTTTQPATNAKAYLAINASDNGYLIAIINGAANNSKIAMATITYWVP